MQGWLEWRSGELVDRAKASAEFLRLFQRTNNNKLTNAAAAVLTFALAYLIYSHASTGADTYM